MYPATKLKIFQKIETFQAFVHQLILKEFRLYVFSFIETLLISTQYLFNLLDRKTKLLLPIEKCYRLNSVEVKLKWMQFSGNKLSKNSLLLLLAYVNIDKHYLSALKGFKMQFK